MFYDFILKYWKIGLLVLSAQIFIELLILIFKKKVNVFDVLKALILQILPESIRESEAKFGAGNGSDKMAYVIQIVIKALANKFGLNEYDFFKVYGKFIEESVNDIMRTPKSHN